MQNVGVTKQEYYGMLWYFLEWSILTTDLWFDAMLIDILTSMDNL